VGLKSLSHCSGTAASDKQGEDVSYYKRLCRVTAAAAAAAAAATASTCVLTCR